jgi:hypothetical protein
VSLVDVRPPVTCATVTEASGWGSVMWHVVAARMPPRDAGASRACIPWLRAEIGDLPTSGTEQ